MKGQNKQAKTRIQGLCGSDNSRGCFGKTYKPLRLTLVLSSMILSGTANSVDFYWTSGQGGNFGEFPTPSSLCESIRYRNLSRIEAELALYPVGTTLVGGYYMPLPGGLCIPGNPGGIEFQDANGLPTAYWCGLLMIL